VRRIVLFLAVAATMAAMLAVMAVPAFAQYTACHYDFDYETGALTEYCEEDYSYYGYDY
jgi:hypothetical protein